MTDFLMSLVRLPTCYYRLLSQCKQRINVAKWRLTLAVHPEIFFLDTQTRQDFLTRQPIFGRCGKLELNLVCNLRQALTDMQRCYARSQNFISIFAEVLHAHLPNYHRFARLPSNTSRTKGRGSKLYLTESANKALQA